MSALLSRSSASVSVQYTIYGLFGGEANDCYDRGVIEIDENSSDLSVVRAVKSAVGWNGLRCKREEIGETISLTPYGILQRLDIDPVY